MLNEPTHALILVNGWETYALYFAFPGSSGGGVYLQNGEYVGMIVRGAGENFNLMVPVRRMEKWAKKHDIMWALNPKLKAPSLDDIRKLPVESVSKKDDDKESSKKSKKKMYPYLIRITDKSTGEVLPIGTELIKK